MKYTTVILIEKDNFEKFKETNIEIINEKFCEIDGWYPCDSYELTLLIPFEINIINTLKKFNLYDGLTLKGIEGKDEGLKLYLNSMGC